MEEKVPYLVQDNNRTFSQTWAVQMVHVAMISDLVARGLAKNASDAVRQAIEAFYQSSKVEG